MHVLRQFGGTPLPEDHAHDLPLLVRHADEALEEALCVHIDVITTALVPILDSDRLVQPIQYWGQELCSLPRTQLLLDECCQSLRAVIVERDIADCATQSRYLRAINSNGQDVLAVLLDRSGLGAPSLMVRPDLRRVVPGREQDAEAGGLPVDVVEMLIEILA